MQVMMEYEDQSVGMSFWQDNNLGSPVATSISLEHPQELSQELISVTVDGVSSRTAVLLTDNEALTPRSKARVDSAAAREQGSLMCEECGVEAVVAGEGVPRCVGKPAIHVCVALCPTGGREDEERERILLKEVPHHLHPQTRRLLDDIKGAGRFPEKSLIGTGASRAGTLAGVFTADRRSQTPRYQYHWNIGSSWLGAQEPDNESELRKQDRAEASCDLALPTWAQPMASPSAAQREVSSATSRPGFPERQDWRARLASEASLRRHLYTPAPATPEPAWNGAFRRSFVGSQMTPEAPHEVQVFPDVDHSTCLPSAARMHSKTSRHGQAVSEFKDLGNWLGPPAAPRARAPPRPTRAPTLEDVDAALLQGQVIPDVDCLPELSAPGAQAQPPPAHENMDWRAHVLRPYSRACAQAGSDLQRVPAEPLRSVGSNCGRALPDWGLGDMLSVRPESRAYLDWGAPPHALRPSSRAFQDERPESRATRSLTIADLDGRAPLAKPAHTRSASSA